MGSRIRRAGEIVKRDLDEIVKMKFKALPKGQYYNIWTKS